MEISYVHRRQSHAWRHVAGLASPLRSPFPSSCQRTIHAQPERLCSFRNSTAAAHLLGVEGEHNHDRNAIGKLTEILYLGMLPSLAKQREGQARLRETDWRRSPPADYCP